MDIQLNIRCLGIVKIIALGLVDDDWGDEPLSGVRNNFKKSISVHCSFPLRHLMHSGEDLC